VGEEPSIQPLFRERAMPSINTTDFSKRRGRLAVKRRAVLSTVIAALLAGGTAFNTAGFSISVCGGSALPSYRQCEAVKDDANRLARYDLVIRHNSLHPANEERPPAGQQP
jgi:hypothetical protein